MIFNEIIRHSLFALGDRLAESGALQLTIANLSIDHYPYHEFRSSKKHWVKYSEMLASNRDEWAARLNEQWNEQFNSAKNNAPTDDMCKSCDFRRPVNEMKIYLRSRKIRKSSSKQSNTSI